MKVVISGASGYIGKLASTHFEQQGYEIVPIGRIHFQWNIHDFKELLRGADIFIHLAGAPILKRWTGSYKKVLYSSRTEPTRKIVAAFRLLKERPKIFISASAVGIYNTSETIHTESSTLFGDDFLSDLVKHWEAELSKIDELVDVRHSVFRLGVVLGRKSKVYKQLLLPLKLGIGGRVAKGTQGFPMIHEADLLNAFDFVVNNPKVEGIFNLSIPKNTDNKTFTKKLAKALKRPSFMIIPGFLLNILYGGASVIMVKGPHVQSERLQQFGFAFNFDSADKIIKVLTNKKRKKQEKP
jgi:uncharacterized protein